MFGRSGQATERSELLLRTMLPIEQEIEARLSVYVPADFPIDDTRLIINQWKQGTIRYGLKRSPVLATRYRNGRLSITINTDNGREELYAAGGPTAPALHDRWSELRYRVRFAKDRSGVLDVWLDGEQIVSYRGLLAYESDFNRFRFRNGLYRDAMDEPMTLYYDNVQIATRY